MLSGIAAGMMARREETSGPVAPIVTFDSGDEAIALANETEFGLAAHVYACDIGRVWQVAGTLEYGMVGHNTGLISNADSVRRGQILRPGSRRSNLGT